ncbi:hypothetical protein [Sphingobium yanoikuyae]|uniref:hypothetical protein n=1 Tax=Sphingobium yanoikuyae TaxID=13690 RepID=UPI0008473211|nr:hypothetical protein [Sphingobium yanoikuyae]
MAIKTSQKLKAEIRPEVVADVLSQTGTGGAPFRATFTEAISDLAVSEYFTCAETGYLRTYQRTATAPYYEDQGDVAAPVSQAQMSAFPGPLQNGTWKRIFSLPRLLLSGSGTVTIDARNRSGTVVLAVETYTLTAASGQIEYPYFGDDAVEVRATITGTATAEII